MPSIQVAGKISTFTTSTYTH